MHCPSRTTDLPYDHTAPRAAEGARTRHRHAASSHAASWRGSFACVVAACVLASMGVWPATSVWAAKTKPASVRQLASPPDGNNADAARASADAPIVEAREAFRRRDGARLAALRAQVLANEHPLAAWVDYWDLSSRITSAQASDVDAFYERWRGRYLEDRLRNDWLLETGRRRDWDRFRVDHPRFVMADDREVACYALQVQHLDGKPVKAAALDAWVEQREADDGCQLLATTLLRAGVFGADEVWHKVRHAIDQGRLKSARQAAAVLDPSLADTIDAIVQQPARHLNSKAAAQPRAAAELTAIALARLATSDPELAAMTLRTRWQQALPPTLLAWAWGQVAEKAAQKQQPEAHDHAQAALRAADGLAPTTNTTTTPQHADARSPMGDDALAWAVRAALRSSHASRWATITRAVDAMSAGARNDPAWRYWHARAAHETAAAGDAGQAQRNTARNTLETLAGELHFYGVLAAEDLGRPFAAPTRPDAVSADERETARKHAGLRSALAMMAAGLREEGVREWNYSLRGMNDRELIAAAQWACEREVWDRCINTSDRTRALVDVTQRYPTPFRANVVQLARDAGLDAAYVYGLIRQESRFITVARSHVGASGLMQLMPATARWTARRLGLPLAADAINDPQTNLRLGTHYLKLVLDDFEGSHPLAAAAYNAGPSRSRRWREGPPVEPAAWAESIPFDETRDYVKKVLTNSVIYAAVLGEAAPSLKARLGSVIGPRETTAKAADRDLP